MRDTIQDGLDLIGCCPTLLHILATILVEQLMQNHSWLIAGLGDGAAA